MDFSLWLLFFVTEILLCLTPGPAVIYVFSQGISRGARPALAANLGIVTGNTIYFILSATGLGALILASQTLFEIVKWAGAAYLIWFGATAFFGRKSSLTGRSSAMAPLGPIYRGGIIVQLANPKNLIFFLAILPQFINPTGNIPLQILILGITSQVAEFAVLTGYGMGAGRMSRWLRTTRIALWVDRVAGGLLIAIGASLAFVRQANT